MTSELDAFASVDFDWTSHLQSVWRDTPYHVEDINGAIADDIAGYALRSDLNDMSPLGRVVVGSAGAGKTHLIGELRRRMWSAKGAFVLLDIVGITDFWRTAALGYITSLQQPMPDGRAQLEAILGEILKDFLREPDARQAFQRWSAKSDKRRLDLVNLFISLLRRRDPGRTLRHGDVVRSLLLLASEDWDTANLAYSWLQGLDVDPVESRKHGFLTQPPAATEVVRGMSWFMSLAGPTLVAVDQIDAIVSSSNLRSDDTREPLDESERKTRSIIDVLAGGLMDLRDVTTRSVTVLTCLEATWEIIKSKAIASAPQRFRDVTLLKGLNGREAGERLIATRLSGAYATRGFTPPYPTWPFPPQEIAKVVGLAPRLVLMKCEDFRRACVERGEATECGSLVVPLPPPGPPEPGPGLDAAFGEALQNADPSTVLGQSNEDAFRDLLAETLALYLKQFAIPEDVDAVVQADADLRKPALHGRLAFTFHSEGDREEHYCFRVLEHQNAVAFQSRLGAAMTASGIDRALKFRKLVVFRREAPPSGAKTSQLVEKFRNAGGMFVALSDSTVGAFMAVREIARRYPDTYSSWLRARRPLCALAVFRIVGLCPPPFPEENQASANPVSGRQQGDGLTPAPRHTTVAAERQPSHAENAEPEHVGLPDPTVQRAILIGRRWSGSDEGAVVALPADLLPRHVAILAGSGSGKTVLLRRIVEEAALLGIPAVVLDPNNDLARLGEPWPSRPEGFTIADEAKATAYGARAEVVVWTPGFASGNPLDLALLPDFGAVESDDERDQAVGMARATLLPFVGATGVSGRLKDGVLADALGRFARGPDGGLQAFIDFLADLPDGVSRIRNADTYADQMANQLRAAVATNPLLKGTGPALDPGALFRSSAAGKTRISVLNLSGLEADEARQAFVNQLQMALFSWIRRHPSPTGLLYVMDEAHNFAPSQRTTPCKESSLALARQARKYGLGMIFATQAPKDIDNKIISNCTTHFYGRMSSPATLQATRELMAAKGARGEDDIGKLGRGEFYFSTEGQARPIRIRTPLCLSYHPANPLTGEEVAERARLDRSLAPDRSGA